MGWAKYCIDITEESIIRSLGKCDTYKAAKSTLILKAKYNLTYWSVVLEIKEGRNYRFYVYWDLHKQHEFDLNTTVQKV